MLNPHSNTKHLSSTWQSFAAVTVKMANNRSTVQLDMGRKEILKGLGINKKNDYPAEAVRQTGIHIGMQNTRKDFQDIKRIVN